MNFIELTCKNTKQKMSINADLIENIDNTCSSTHIVMDTLNDTYYQVLESYSEVMAKIHKVKRLEIASRMIGHVTSHGIYTDNGG